MPFVGITTIFFATSLSIVVIIKTSDRRLRRHGRFG